MIEGTTEFNSYLQPLNAPVTTPKAETAMEAETMEEIQGRKIRFSRVNIVDIVQESNLASNVYGTADWGTTLDQSHTLTFTTQLTATKPANAYYNDIRLCAIPLVSIYSGTAIDATKQIYPTRGGAITFGSFRCQSGYDYATSAPNSLHYMVSIDNVSAGTISNLAVQTIWLFVSTYDSKA